MAAGEIDTVVLILGMHRSGTSALARSMSLLGYGIPKTLIKANSTNASGHWESRRLARLNDKILEACDLEWSSWNTGSFSFLDAQNRQRFQSDIVQTLRSEFDGHSQIVLKDPRISRLTPLYLEALESIGAKVYPIICFRNPLEVAESLNKRNSLNAIDAVQLWLRYTLEAEHATRHLKRHFVGYDTLMSDWRSVLEGVQDNLTKEWPIELNDAAPLIDTHLNRNLRHHAYSSADTIHDERTEGWAADAFGALEVLQHNALAEHPLETLAQIKTEIDAASSAMLSLSALRDKQANEARDEHEREKQKLLSEAQELRSKNEYLNDQNSHLVANRDEFKNAVNSMKTARDSLEAKLRATESAKSAAQKDAESKQLALRDEIASLETRLRASESAKSATAKELRQLKRQQWRLKDELSWQKDLLHATHESTSWRITAPLRKVKHLLSNTPVTNAADPQKKNSVPAQSGNFNPSTVKTSATPVGSNVTASTPNQESVPDNLQLQIRTIQSSGAFDLAYYMANAPEVQTYSGTPLEHYILHGWRKGLDPSAEFNSNAWLASHPHLKTGTRAPLFDFLMSMPSHKTSRPAMDKVGRVAVFGAISGDYDDLKDPEFEHDNVDYFMFTEQELPEYSTWRKKDFEFISHDPTRTARFVKTHPHLYFGEYDWAIWVDSNLQIKCDPRSLILDLGEQAQIATWTHPLRSCVFEEATECIARGKDDEGTINSLIAFLESEGFPKKAGLFETSVFVSRMGDIKVDNFFNDWWVMIDKYSRRDQLSLPYLLGEHSLEISRLAEPGVCMRTDPRFVYYRHQK